MPDGARQRCCGSSCTFGFGRAPSFPTLPPPEKSPTRRRGQSALTILGSTLAKTLRATGRVGPTPSLTLKPGARLVREWHGRTHAVTVTEDGFDYAGTSYSSLSNIAKKITGAHWSGPRFFGLLAKGKTHPSGAHNG
ncbi:MAG: DUF2924 domain-containing protein [Deltaproteobacteria bacterium]|nr:DUF2924 domain-containing protein [Deltaproteobacteria bacterium]